MKKYLSFLRGIYPEDFVRKPPVFGTLSILALPIGFTVAAVAQSLSNFGGCMGGLAALFQFVAIILFSLLAGSGCALVGLWRGERYRGLGFIGFAVDFVPTLLMFAAWRT